MYPNVLVALPLFIHLDQPAVSFFDTTWVLARLDCCGFLGFSKYNNGACFIMASLKRLAPLSLVFSALVNYCIYDELPFANHLKYIGSSCRL